jgi:hypothetical protein
MCVKDENLSKLGQPFKPNIPQSLRQTLISPGQRAICWWAIR